MAGLRVDDHLDERTIREIEQHHGGVVRYFVPSSLGKWFVNLGVPYDRVTEMGWWDEMDISGPSDARVPVVDHTTIPLVARKNDSAESLVSDFDAPRPRFRIICTPAQHNSGRSIFGKNKTLWATWFLDYTLPSGDHFRCFFGG